MATHDRPIGHESCLDHLKEELTFFCQTCKIPVCSKCVVAEQHKGHNFDSLQTHAQAKYNELQDFKREVTNHMIPEIQEKGRSADQEFEEVVTIIQSQIKTSKDEGAYLKEIEYIELLERCKEHHASYKTEIGDALQILDQLIKDSTNARKSNSNILLVDTAKEVAMKKPILSNYIKPTIPKYALSLEPKKRTNVLFRWLKGKKAGTIRETNSSDTKPILKSEKPIASTSGASATPKERRGKTGLQQQMSFPTRDLMRTPVVKEFASLRYPPLSIVRRKDGTLCVCYFLRFLTLIDDGGTENYVTCDVGISDIAVHPHTDLMYCIRSFRKDVRSLNHKTGETEKMFDIEVEPKCLAVTHDDTVIIGDVSEPLLHIYTMTGNKLQTVQCVGDPWHVSVCRSTGRVAVACGEKGAMIIDDKYQTLFTVKRHCEDVVFDGHGYLFVLDCKTHVHVLNATTGEHITIITIYKMETYLKLKCMDTMKSGELAVGTNSGYGTVLSIEYLQ